MMKPTTGAETEKTDGAKAAGFTRGPWEVFHRDGYDGISKPAHIGIMGPDCHEIAWMYGWRDPAIVQANAEFIVRACDSHEDLLAACRAAIPALILLGDFMGNDFKGQIGIPAFNRCELIQNILDAIEKAEKGKAE